MGAESYLCLVRIQCQFALSFFSSCSLSVFSYRRLMFDIANVHPNGKGSNARCHARSRPRPRSLLKRCDKCTVEIYRPTSQHR